MAERDAICAQMKPSCWGSHTAAHASVTSLIPLSTACVWHGNEFNCNISEAWMFSSTYVDWKDWKIGGSARLFDNQLINYCVILFFEVKQWHLKILGVVSVSFWLDLAARTRLRASRRMCGLSSDAIAISRFSGLANREFLCITGSTILFSSADKYFK